MNRKSTRWSQRALLVLLVSSLLTMLAGGGLVTAAVLAADPVRTLPEEVTPGQEFEVTVTFTSPANEFNAVGLNDAAPAGWSVIVDAAWVTPTATVSTPEPNEAEFWWLDSYDAGVSFTVMYKVTVPGDAEPGTYTFPGGELEYYVEETNYVEAIDGDYEVEVVEATDSSEVGLKASTPVALGCMELIKLFDAPDGVDFPRDEIAVQVTGDDFDETYTLKAEDDWKKTICELVPGTYTVEELTAEANWSVTYDPASRELVVVDGDEPGPGATLTITSTFIPPPVIGINVEPSAVDFGIIEAGGTFTGDTLTVTNTGNVEIDVSVVLDDDTPYASDGSDLFFYTAALKLNGEFSDRHSSPTEFGEWAAGALGLENMEEDESKALTTELACPAEMYADTEYTGTLIFWAVASEF